MTLDSNYVFQHYHFERSVRFWRAVQAMKDVEDPRLRQLKIKAIVNQFFSKGAATGVGFDGQVLREISSTPPDKVTVSMLISGGFSNSLSVSSLAYWSRSLPYEHQFESPSQHKLVS